MTEPATTTPDPEFNIPASGEPKSRSSRTTPRRRPHSSPGAEGAGHGRGRYLDGPAGAARLGRAAGTHRPGTIYSPGKGITEEEAEREARTTG